MAYCVEIMPRAGRQLKRLPDAIKRRIDQAIRHLGEEPRPPGCLKLQASGDAWRIRVGEYRVIYEIHDDVLVVLVIRVDHRSIAYR